MNRRGHDRSIQSNEQDDLMWMLLFTFPYNTRIRRPSVKLRTNKLVLYTHCRQPVQLISCAGKLFHHCPRGSSLHLSQKHLVVHCPRGRNSEDHYSINLKNSSPSDYVWQMGLAVLHFYSNTATESSRH